jgi:hypothetical protein
MADSDVAGLVWEVDPGATVRGKVVANSGAPVEDTIGSPGSRGASSTSRPSSSSRATRRRTGASSRSASSSRPAPRPGLSSRSAT